MKEAVLFTGLFLFSCIQLTAQTDQVKINEAMNLFKQKKFEEARVQILRSEGKSERKNSASFAMMAWFINEARKYGFVYDEASYGKDSWLPDVLYKAEKALKYDKDNAMGHLMRGAALYEKSDFANASKEYDIVEKLDPSNCYLTLYRGNIDGATGLYEPAVTKYQKFITCNPDYPFVYWYLTKAYIGQHKLDDALAACKKYVNLANSRGAKDSLVGCYYTMAAQSPGNLKYLDSAYACINAIFGEYGYSGWDVKAYYAQYKYLAQISYNYSNKPTLDLVNACIENNIDAALAAVKNGANPNCLFDNRRYYRFKTYPILFAARVQSYALMKALLEAGANPDARDDIGYTALHYLSSDEFKNKNERESLANLLVKYNANVNIRNIDNKTPLMQAQSVDFAKFLIVNHADVKAKDKDGHSLVPLVYSGYDNTAGIVKLYIDNGADVNEVSPNGRNIFDDAMYLAPVSYAILYLLEKAKVHHTARYDDASYTSAKEFIEYLQANVIDRPAALLFDALIESNLKKFKAALVDVKEKKLLNYLSIATVNFTYGKAFYNALVVAGADVAFQQYSMANKGPISGRSVFYTKKTGPNKLADFELLYGERMEELMADAAYYGERMKMRNLQNEICDNVILFAKTTVKMIDLFKEAQANPAISTESRKTVAGFEKAERETLSHWATQYSEQVKCSVVFPRAN